MNLVRLLLIFIAVSAAAIVVLPADLAYVETGSMEPVIGAGDLFLIHESDSYAEGDIITFYSMEQDDFVTHRIVDEESDGYITQGDANERTDQYNGDPPIRHEHIIGGVFTINNQPVTVPQAGFVSQFFGEYRVPILVLLFFGILIDYLRKRGRGNSSAPKKESISFRMIVLYIVLLLVLVWTGFTYASADTTSMTYLVEDNPPSEDERFIMTGEEVIRTSEYTIDGGGLPLHSEASVIGSDVNILNASVDQGQYNVTYEVGPYYDEGTQSVDMIVYMYPKTLPRGVISMLHTIHPLFASIGTVSVFGVPFIFLAFALFDGTPVRAQAIRSQIRRLIN